MDKESINKGLQLKFVRQYRGYSQQELTEKIPGLSQSNLSRFERGFHGMIADDLLTEIMNFLNWPVEWLDIPTPNRHIKN